LQKVKGGYSPDEGETVVISGRTSHGKTMLATDEMRHFAMTLNVPCALAELDMSERMWRRRTAASIAGVNSFKFDFGNATGEEHEKLNDGWRVLNNAPIYVCDKRMSIGDILAWGSMLVARRGVRVLCVDHLTKIRMTHSEYNQNPRILYGEWVARLQDFAKRHKVFVIILVQSNTRDSDKYMDKTPPISGLGSIKESGAIEENVDGAILINKKPDEPTENYTKDNPLWEMVLNVAKNRARGPTGLVPIFLWTYRQKFVSYQHGCIIRNELERVKRERMSDHAGA
jgi:replicative DNA helicase